MSPQLMPRAVRNAASLTSLFLSVACASRRAVKADPLMSSFAEALAADIRKEKVSDALNAGSETAWVIEVRDTDTLAAKATKEAILSAVGGRRSLASDTVAERVAVYDVTKRGAHATINVDRGRLFCDAGTPTATGTTMTYVFRFQNGGWARESRTDNVSYDRGILPAKPESADACARAFAPPRN